MYIISQISTYDNDNLLWETKIGTDEKDMPLKLSAWGKTEEESRTSASELVKILNK